jgi:SAM-dependent methyltransferase
MTSETAWHEDERFWEVMGPFMFTLQSRELALQQVELLLELLQVPPGASFLDMCCGPGRHALELGRRGFHVTGVDRTFCYLQEAQDTARKEKLDIEFVQGDMRQFRRPQTFDFGLIMYTSFGFFADADDERRVLQNMHDSLKPGGKLLMELMGKESLARQFRPRGWREVDGAFMLEEGEPIDGWTYIKNRWIVIKDGKAEEFQLTVRIYAASELTTLLRQAGFARATAYGSLGGSPYDHTATRLIVVAEK